MITTLYSAKGGPGVSTTAALMALAAARSDGRQVTLVDLCGDQPYLFGAFTDPPGVTEWAEHGCADGRLDQLLKPVSSVDHDGTADLLPLGGWSPVLSRLGTGPQMRGEPTAVAEALGAWMQGRGHVIVDAGNLADPRDEPGRHWQLRRAVAEASNNRILVTRQCVLSLRSNHNMEINPTGVLLVAEAGSSLTRTDIERATGAPIIGTIPVSMDTARAAASGLGRTRLDSDPLDRVGKAYSEIAAAHAPEPQREPAGRSGPHLGLVDGGLG